MSAPHAPCVLETAESRYVLGGNVITGGDVTAGIDMALTVTAEIAGGDYAQTVQLAIEYSPAAVRFGHAGGSPKLASSRGGAGATTGTSWSYSATISSV